jgi:predicted phage baseplate assembly protein
MALTGPILDDRSFEQLRDELVRRIPVYAPEWTNHNESDPGIALLELFAYLGESLLYRFNQIPDTTKIAFLRLLGVQPRSAQVARALMALETERAQGVQVLIGVEARAGDVSFETEAEVYAWPLTALAVGKMKAPDPPAEKRARRLENHRRDDAFARLFAQAKGQLNLRAEPLFYEVATVPTDPTAVDARPLEVDATLDRALWVALMAKDGTDLAQLSGRALFVGVAFDETLQRPFDLAALNPKDPTRFRAEELIADPPPVLWQLWNGPGAREPLAALAVDRDGTRGLTTTGVVTLQLPKELPTLSVVGTSSADPLAPPVLDDEEAAANVVAWLRVSRPEGENDGIRRITWVGTNAVPVVQARTATAELMGTGTAEPDQQYALAHRPVLPGTLRLEVEELDGWTEWTEVSTFATSADDDRHYQVDFGEGMVHFGAKAPQIGERIRVLSYRYGGGAVGNVPAGAISQLVGVAGVKGTNVFAASGGSDGADLTEALKEIPAELHRRDRAVAAEDFQALTLQVPGVQRADVMPLFHPDTPGVERPGVVTVVVFPSEDLASPAAPMPDLALLRRVARWLNPRRLITTELYAVPPTYREIAVSVGVRVRDGYQVDAVRRWVELILRQYLAPVPPFGPDGRGWPLGRDVRRAELEAVAVQVEGVEYLEGELQLAVGSRAPDGAVTWTVVPRVDLLDWEVPQLTAITVTRGSALSVGSGYTPAPGPGDPILVPLPPEVC